MLKWALNICSEITGTNVINMIYTFRGEYGWLSNFAECPIEIKGIIYPSVENAYMSCKNPEDKWKFFCRDNDASTVKKESKQIKLRENWDKIRLTAMKYCLLQKFTQEPFKSKLLATGDENIVEGNYWNDTFWGVDLKQNPNIGENHLGRLIMGVRKYLREN